MNRTLSNSNKKGQMEMMGLVIIVILITLGLLFMALFNLKDESKKKVFTREGLASSTISAVLKTTVANECSSYIGVKAVPQLGEDILEDCALNYQEYFLDETLESINPLGYSQYQCAGVHSCQFFKDMANELLEDTLGQWGKKYQFRATLIYGVDTKKELILIKKGGCPGERDSSGLFPLQVSGAGLIETELWVCG